MTDLKTVMVMADRCLADDADWPNATQAGNGVWVSPFTHLNEQLYHDLMTHRGPGHDLTKVIPVCFFVCGCPQCRKRAGDREE